VADVGEPIDINPEHRELMAKQAEVASRGYDLLAQVERAKAEFQEVRAEMLRTNLDASHIMDCW
jgi:hypothetical protein